MGWIEHVKSRYPQVVRVLLVLSEGARCYLHETESKDEEAQNSDDFCGAIHTVHVSESVDQVPDTQPKFEIAPMLHLAQHCTANATISQLCQIACHSRH